MNASSTSAIKTCLCALLLFCAGALVPSAHAQKNEFAFLASSFQTSASFNVHGGEGLQLNYAHRLVDIKLAALYLEIPFEAGWGGSRSITQGNLLHENYNTTYLTPGLKLKILPTSFISPYLAGGLGWGGFRSTNTSATSNKFAGDIGGGVDFTILPILSLRAEVRDYYTSAPTFDVQSVFHGSVNNVVISGGAVFRF
ncbi:MAG: outer membrane beta-barrel protein [Candidatus Korobacteraceae bacterium]